MVENEMAQGDRRPIPDPTTLTTEALMREISRVDERIVDLKEAVYRHFASMEAQRVEQKADAKDAINAALASQKEAVTKAEIAMSKQLDQLSEHVDKTVKDIRRELSEIKERLSEQDRKVGG